MIVAEQSPEAFSPYHVPRLTTNSSLWRDEPVAETLMIALGVIVAQILADRLIEGAFTQHDHPFQGFFLDGAYKPFAMGIEIRTPQG